MVAPGFVGVTVPPGRHTVVFTYRAYPAYAALLLIGVLVIVALSFMDRSSARRSRRGTGLMPLLPFTSAADSRGAKARNPFRVPAEAIEEHASRASPLSAEARFSFRGGAMPNATEDRAGR